MSHETSTSVDRSFSLMGTHMRLVIGAASRPGLPTPEQTADRVVALLEDYDARLSRFRADSELSALNADPRTTVPASQLLRDAIRVALWTAERTDGLVDPTVLDELESAGYVESWKPERRIDLHAALSGDRPAPKPAAPRAAERWREVSIDDDAGTITRPAGLRLDTGGSGKGHAAELAAELLAGYEAWAMDCGGDLRIGGDAGLVRDVDVEHPFTGETLETIQVRDGAVATSGLRSRIWLADDGSVRHHLLDPSTGQPAFTGLVAVTALAPSTVEAEALAKAALLRGPAGARATLARHGGITVAEDGTVERIGRLAPAPRVRLRLPVPPTNSVRSAA
mgnify:CR=1 FL=1